MASPIPIDPYEVLGVSKNADLSTIRAAHRKLALKFHPDRIKDENLRKKGTEEFQKAQQAYEILSDDKRRARYDDQVKLAQLKKEAMERGGPTRSTSYPMAQPGAPPRPNPSSPYEYANARMWENGRMYEERRPRYSDEDDRYAEPPPRSTRKTPTSERRPYTAHPDERKKKHSEKSSYGFTSFMESKIREKAQKARERTSSHAEAAKARDKDRRRESFEKNARRNVYVEDYDSSSDSDTIRPTRRPEPPRRSKTYYEDTRRKPESPPLRKRQPKYVSEPSSSESTDDDYDSSRDEWVRKHRYAANYISERSNGKPSVLQSDSAKYYTIPREKSSGRKSGSDKEDRREERPRSAKTSRPADVVDPPRRNPQSRKTPTMKPSNSSPAGLKPMTRDGAPQPQRSATGEYQPEHRRPIPTMNRSHTMPVPTSSRKEPTPSKNSKLKQSETHDSGYGSSGPNTPELHGTSPPKTKSTRTFFIVEEDPEHSRSRAVPVGDSYPSRRTRSPSPAGRERDRDERREKDKDRKRQERPTLQTNTSYGTSRSTPYTISPEQISSRPTAFRTDSSRSSVPRGHGDSSKDETYRFKPDNVRYSPQLNSENIRYTRHGKSDLHSRDYYPGSTHTDNLHAPKNGRRESIY